MCHISIRSNVRALVYRCQDLFMVYTGRMVSSVWWMGLVWESKDVTYIAIWVAETRISFKMTAMTGLRVVHS